MADATTIISRLATKFTNSIKDREQPDFLTRDIGGHWRSNQPYISGYFQVIYGLPSELFGGADNVQIASKWLHSTCEGFSIFWKTTLINVVLDIVLDVSLDCPKLSCICHSNY